MNVPSLLAFLVNFLSDLAAAAAGSLRTPQCIPLTPKWRSCVSTMLLPVSEVVMLLLLQSVDWDLPTRSFLAWSRAATRVLRFAWQRLPADKTLSGDRRRS